MLNTRATDCNRSREQRSIRRLLGISRCPATFPCRANTWQHSLTALRIRGRGASPLAGLSAPPRNRSTRRNGSLVKTTSRSPGRRTRAAASRNPGGGDGTPQSRRHNRRSHQLLKFRRRKERIEVSLSELRCHSECSCRNRRRPEMCRGSWTASMRNGKCPQQVVHAVASIVPARPSTAIC